MLQLLLCLGPPLPAQQARAVRKERRLRRGRGDREERERAMGLAGSERGASGAASPQPRRRARCGWGRSTPPAARAPAAPPHPRTACVFVFPGPTDTVASPLLRRPRGRDGGEAGVLRGNLLHAAGGWSSLQALPQSPRAPGRTASTLCCWLMCSPSPGAVLEGARRGGGASWGCSAGG